VVVHIFDAIIGFAAIMLVASLVVTAGTQLIISLLGLRGVNLRRSLADLFDSACDDRDARRYAKEIARRVLRHPLISGSTFSRFGVRIEDLPFVPADAAGKLRWAGSEIPFQPWLLGALSGFFLWPATLAAMQRLSNLDITAASAAIARYLPFLNLCEHPWRSGAIVGAVLGGLISRWRLASSVRVDEMVAVLERLSTPPGGSLPDPAQRAMLVIAGEAQSAARVKNNPAPGQLDKFARQLADDDPDIAAEVDKTMKQVSAQMEPRADGVTSWFDHAMARASQRFTLQARVISVSLALVLVLGARLDAVRLVHEIAADGQVRSQLSTGVDLMTKQAAQLSRPHDDSAGRVAVPDVYRKAMLDVLQITPVNAEPVKAKPHHSSHHAATVASASAAPDAPVAENQPDGAVTATDGNSSPADGNSAAPAAKEHKHKAVKTSKAKEPAAEPVKDAVPLGENKSVLEAKSRVLKQLEQVPGFASREDAVGWLGTTLRNDPAMENLVANYQLAVNADLSSDSDRLLDRSASLQHELAASQLQLVAVNRSGWQPTRQEMPGLLVALALISLGAPLCFYLLKRVASLQPPAITGNSVFPASKERREERRTTPSREQVVRPAVKNQVKITGKVENDQDAVVSSAKERQS